MKSIVLVLLSLIPAVAFAQQDYVGASATLIANRGNAGYNEIGGTSWTFGVNAEVAKNVLGDRLVILGSAGYDRMQKVYIGDGHDTRFGGYARLYLNGEQGDDARFFAPVTGLIVTRFEPHASATECIKFTGTAPKSKVVLVNPNHGRKEGVAPQTNVPWSVSAPAGKLTVIQ